MALVGSLRDLSLSVAAKIGQPQRLLLISWQPGNGRTDALLAQRLFGELSRILRGQRNARSHFIQTESVLIWPYSPAA